MAQRSNRRRVRRRGRFSGLYKLLSALLILAALVAGCLVFFRVDTVVVSGNQRYTQEEIIQVSGVSQGENLFALLLRRGEIAQTLREQLPYVEAVSIRTALPDTLIVEVRECQAAAYITYEGADWLLNTSGKLLERVEQGQTGDALEITGVTALQPSPGTPLAVSVEESRKLADLLALMQALEERELLAGADSIDLSSDSRMEMRYEDRLTVRFAYASDYSYDAKALQAAIDYLGPEERSVVDLTFEDGPHLYQEQGEG